MAHSGDDLGQVSYIIFEYVASINKALGRDCSGPLRGVFGEALQEERGACDHCY